MIIKNFRNATAPGISGALASSPVLWTYPKIVYLALYPNTKFLKKFKPCVIDNVAVNYTPGNKLSPLRNGTGTIGDNPPAVVQLQMEFIELEYWIENQYNDSNIPDDVYGNTAQPQSSQGPAPIPTGQTALAKYLGLSAPAPGGGPSPGDGL